MKMGGRVSLGFLSPVPIWIVALHSRHHYYYVHKFIIMILMYVHIFSVIHAKRVGVHTATNSWQFYQGMPV